MGCPSGGGGGERVLGGPKGGGGGGGERVLGSPRGGGGGERGLGSPRGGGGGERVLGCPKGGGGGERGLGKGYLERDVKGPNSEYRRVAGFPGPGLRAQVL